MKKEKLLSIDAMRTISILAVILIHTSTRVLEYKHYDLLTYWPTLLLNQLSRFAVPLFFLISGFVLELNFRDDLGFWGYIKKRLSKVLVPYIFWSLFYYLFIYTQNTENFFVVLLKGGASYQLYFIPTILAFYIIFPLIHKYLNILTNPLVLAVLTYSQVALMNKDYLIRQFNYPDPIRIFLMSYIFFIVGVVAAGYKKNLINIPSLISYLLIPVSIYLGRFIYLEGMVRYYKTFNISAFYSQWRPDILLYTLCLALVFFYLFKYPNRIQILLVRMSRLSYLVFFIHVFLLEFVWYKFGVALFNLIPKKPIQIMVFDIYFFFSVSALSFLIAYLIHKIPRLNKITG